MIFDFLTHFRRGAITTSGKFSSLLAYATLLFCLFLLVFHFVIYALSPFEAVYPLAPVWKVLIVYFAVFSITVVSGLKFLPSINSSFEGPVFLSGLDKHQLFKKMLILAAVGVVLHVYSKYYLTTIRPISCLFEIRYAWIEISHDILPVYVRVASVLGHVLSSFSYAGTFIACWGFVAADSKNERQRAFIYAIAFLLAGVIYGGFIGSRNAMLAYIIMGFWGIIVGVCSVKLAKRILLRGLIVFVLLVVVGIGFSSAVFSDRIFCSSAALPGTSREDVVQDYLLGYGDELPVDFSHSSYQILNRVCPTCSSTFLYINHGILNLSQVMAKSEKGQNELFGFLSAWKTKITGQNINQNTSPVRAYGRGGIPFAGAAYYEYGWMGVIGTAFLMGALFGFGLWLMRFPRILFSAGVFVTASCFYILALSNIFVPFKLLPFPFVEFSLMMSIFVLPLLRLPKR